MRARRGGRLRRRVGRHGDAGRQGVQRRAAHTYREVHAWVSRTGGRDGAAGAQARALAADAAAAAAAAAPALPPPPTAGCVALRVLPAAHATCPPTSSLKLAARVGMARAPEHDTPVSRPPVVQSVAMSSRYCNSQRHRGGAAGTSVVCTPVEARDQEQDLPPSACQSQLQEEGAGRGGQQHAGAGRAGLRRTRDNPLETR